MKGPSKRRFDEIYTAGKRFRGETLTLIVESGSGLVGIATSKKLGAKPSRNRHKRRIRSMLQLVDLPEGFDHVIVAGVKVSGRSYATLQAELTNLIQEAHGVWEGGSESC